SKIEIQIKGPDADYIYSVAEEIEDILRGVPGAIDIKHNWENRVTQYLIEVDQQRAKRAGVTSQDVAKSLQSYFSGNQISEFREGDDIFPIVVRAADRERFDPSRVHTVNVFSQNMNMNVPLEQVANIKLVNNYSKIARENMFRTITVEAKSTLMTAESMVPLIDDKLKALSERLPPNHLIEYDGVIEQSHNAQAALRANLPLCIGIILILLVAQFNSFKRTGIII